MALALLVQVALLWARRGFAGLIHCRAMTLVVKLGSSVVATDRGALRGSVLASICEQVSVLVKRDEAVVLVTSGAIARGMWLLGRDERPRAMDELQATSAIGQGDLFRAYETRLRRRETRAAQVLLTRSDINRRENYRNARQTIQRLLQWGIVPIVNENDTTATEEISFGDNDFLAAQVAVFLHARRLILLTNTDGLYSSDPRLDSKARLVKRVESLDEISEVQIGQLPSHLGRGGMASKVAAAEMASQSGIEAVICNGRKDGVLIKAAAGKSVGTRFLPSKKKQKTSVFKLWLKYANRPKATLFVDSGAAKKLRGSGSSLLAVGVVSTSGPFEAGDVVAVKEKDTGVMVGHGVAEFSTLDLKRIRGRKSAWVRKHFPEGPDEVIHRDRFVLV